MPGREFSSSNYRYGFNGKENDSVAKGIGNQLDFGNRIYDPRIGRWLSLDPLQNKYPGLSPYGFAANNPIYLIDPDGRDVGIAIYENPSTIIYTNTIYVSSPALAKSLQKDFDAKYGSSLKGKSSDGKWNLSINLVFKYVKNTDEIQARINKGNTPEVIIQGNGTNPNAYTPIGGNYIYAGSDFTKHSDAVIHEVIHTMGMSDQYSDLAIFDENNRTMEWIDPCKGTWGNCNSKNASSTVANKGYEHDILGDTYYLKGDGSLGTNTEPLGLVQSRVDAMVNFALQKKSELKSNNFVVGDKELDALKKATQATQKDRPAGHLTPDQTPPHIKSNLKKKS